MISGNGRIGDTLIAPTVRSPTVAHDNNKMVQPERSDRRAAVRNVCQVCASACALGKVDSLARWATITDQSSLGIGIFAPRLYDIGPVLIIWTELRNQEPPILAKVVHRRPEWGG